MHKTYHVKDYDMLTWFISNITFPPSELNVQQEENLGDEDEYVFFYSKYQRLKWAVTFSYHVWWTVV